MQKFMTDEVGFKYSNEIPNGTPYGVDDPTLYFMYGGETPDGKKTSSFWRSSLKRTGEMFKNSGYVVWQFNHKRKQWKKVERPHERMAKKKTKYGKKMFDPRHPKERNVSYYNQFQRKTATSGA